MNALYPMYPDLALLEIDQRLLAAAARRRARLVRHGVGIARRRAHLHDDRPGRTWWR